MEARIARLEVDVDYIKRDVAELKIDVRSLRDGLARLDVTVAKLEERVSHLPGKGFIVSASVTIVGLLTAIIVLGDKIKALVGLAH